MASVASVRPGGIPLQPFVEQPVARQIIVEADDIRWTTIDPEPGELLLSRPAREQIGPERMTSFNPPGQEVESQDPPVILKLRLVREERGAESAPVVVGLNQLRAWMGRPY